PAQVDTVLLADPAAFTPRRVADWAAAAGRPRVWAEVTGPAEALAETGRRLGSASPGPGASAGRYGVRIPAHCPVDPGDLPAQVDTVLLADPAAFTPRRVADWAAAAGRPRVWAEVTGPAEA
ncbi:hypothetical protein, partial [Streptomyces sp. WAC05950]|uniref:hypothetical protein n=1 Tax=Streptomyces sp. WAC05950 TaxID=2487419 RepID=UPI0016529464